MSDPPPEPSPDDEPRPLSDPVVVFRTWDDVEASLVEGLLRSAGIPCALVSDISHAVYPLTVDGLGEIRILVAAEDAEDARQRIAARPLDEGGAVGPPVSADSSEEE